MRRPVHLVIAAALGALALVGFPGVGAAAAGEPVSARQDTSDFTFDSWHSDFELGLDAEGRSTLTTTETIVARFPDFDQNHGLLRAIPTHYDGHPTDITIERVTDQTGTPRSYETDSNGDGGDFLEVTIAADDYVHGAQTYVITYSQVNVTLFPDNATDEEFYWDVNGTGWGQPFGDVSATLQVGPELATRLTGQTTCYRGPEGSAQTCETMTSEADATGWRVDVGASSLGPYENLTMVVAFEPGTFVPRDDSFMANPFPSIGLGAALIGLIATILAAVARSKLWRNAQGRPTIIAEYLPPKGVNLLQAGGVSGAAGKSIAALFLSFAVRGNVRVLESDGEKHYLLELVHQNGLDNTEFGILSILFPGLEPGTLRDLKAKDLTLSRALQGEMTASKTRALSEGLREEKGAGTRGWLVTLAIFSGIVSVFASIIALVTVVGGVWPVLIMLLGIFAAVVTFTFAASIRPLTAAGAELRDYLKGVKLYIGLAEADRLRVLQSPEGALRSPYRPDPTTALANSDSGRPLQVLKLYERLLPFAVLFGQEKEWSGVLGEYYAQSGSQPDWYAGYGTFNAAYFAVGISSFSASTSSSWSGSASSSSSSGSGGGGSSGGGGGGGGGGGV